MASYPVLNRSGAYFQVEVAVLVDVTDVELDAAAVLAVSYCEVVPESVPAGVGVDPQEQVILAFADPHHAVEVGRLELRVEDKFTAGRDSGVHAFERAVVDRRLVILVFED